MAVFFAFRTWAESALKVVASRSFGTSHPILFFTSIRLSMRRGDYLGVGLFSSGSV